MLNLLSAICGHYNFYIFICLFDCRPIRRRVQILPVPRVFSKRMAKTIGSSIAKIWIAIYIKINFWSMANTMATYTVHIWIRYAMLSSKVLFAAFYWLFQVQSHDNKMKSNCYDLCAGKMCVLDCAPSALKMLHSSTEFMPFVIFVAAPGMEQLKQLYAERRATGGSQRNLAVSKWKKKKNASKRHSPNFSMNFLHFVYFCLTVWSSKFDSIQLTSGPNTGVIGITLWGNLIYQLKVQNSIMCTKWFIFAVVLV